MGTKQDLYRDFHKIDLAHLKELVTGGKLDPALADLLLSYWRKRLDDKNDAVYSRYMEYYLFFESLRALFLAVFIFDMKSGNVAHSYGIFPTLSAAIYEAITGGGKAAAGELDFDHNGRRYALHFLHSGYREQEYTIAALAIKDNVITENIHRLKYVFERFYLPSSFSRDNRIGVLFTETENVIAEIVNPALAQKMPVTFTYLYFESMTKYVGLAGENFAKGLIEELKNDVYRVLKDTDRIFILSTREMLIISVNCEKDVLEKRLASTYFHAKSLLLAFKAHYHTVYAPILDMHMLWDDITGNIAYRRKAESQVQSG